MYNEYFNFTELPFSIAPDPYFMFMSTRHQEGLAHLLYGISQGGGFVALTGEVGTGKTTLCHCLLQQLPENIDLALILNPKLNAVELLATICDELKITYDTSKQTLKNLIDALNQFLIDTHAKGRRTVILIDEAQNLSLEVLEQVRLLTNLETSKTKFLQIILVGQPELKDLLSKNELRQLNQRISARYHLLPFTLPETRSYIRHRLTVCKGNPDTFDSDAIKDIYRHSKGIPRVINIICHCALLAAYSKDTKEITPQIIERAVKETLGTAYKSNSVFKTLTVAVVIGCLATGAYFLSKQITDKKSLAAKTIIAGKFPTDNIASPTDAAKMESTKVEPTIAKQEKSPENKPFNSWVANEYLTLNVALNNALKVWGIIPKPGESIGCDSMQPRGLNCLVDVGNWKKITEINRPVILELSLSPEVKRYALLTRIKDDQLTLRYEGDATYPVEDVLKYWEGYYLLVWKVPSPTVESIFPGQTSANVEWLRQQISVIDGINQDTKKPQFYDSALKGRVINFQKKNGLKADGKVGLQSVFYLDNATGAKGSPHLTD